MKKSDILILTGLVVAGGAYFLSQSGIFVRSSSRIGHVEEKALSASIIASAPSAATNAENSSEKRDSKKNANGIKFDGDIISPSVASQSASEREAAKVEDDIALKSALADSIVGHVVKKATAASTASKKDTSVKQPILVDASESKKSAKQPAARPQNPEADSKKEPVRQSIFGDLLPESLQMKDDEKKSNGGFDSVKSRVNEKISMTTEERSGIVKISSAKGAATGFICVLNDTPCIVSNLHVMGGIKDFVVHTMTGESIPIGRIFVAEGHDIAIMPIREIPSGCKAFEMADDVSAVAYTNDDIIVCGNSDGGGSMLETLGTVVAIGPNLIETDCPFYQGNSGSPIFHFKTKKVIGVVSHMRSNEARNKFERTSRNDSRSVIKKDVRYFGYRMDSIKKWQSITPENLNKQYQIIEDIKERYYEILDTGMIIGGATCGITEYTDLNEAATKYLRDRNQNPSRARKELSGRLTKLCTNEIGKLLGVKFISNLGETRDALIEAFRELSKIYREAEKIQ